MAYFYLARVIQRRVVVDGTPAESTCVLMSGPAARMRTQEFAFTRPNGDTVYIDIPRRKYTHPMEARWADGQPNAPIPIWPTTCLVRSEQPLEAGDYAADMTTKGAVAWSNLYTAWPALAARPFPDAPFQPGG